MKGLPYTGVTGFMTPQEVRTALRCYGIPASGRKLMVGVLASAKTLRGEKNKYPNRYPEISRIADIFQKHPAALNLIHYSTDAPGDLSDQLQHLIRCGGQQLDGFQLNVCWPDVDVLCRFHSRFASKYRIVLQVGQNAMKEMGYRPRALADKVARYAMKEAIDDVLIDASGGKGVPLDVGIARDYLRAIADHDLDINLGVAGGLNAESLSSIDELLGEFTKLNIDAEGNLRDPVSDDLDILKMIAYIDRAEKFVTPHLYMHRS